MQDALETVHTLQSPRAIPWKLLWGWRTEISTCDTRSLLSNRLKSVLCRR